MTDTGFVSPTQTRNIQDQDSIMCALGPEGDVKTIWDKSKPEEVENARQTFNNLKAKGYRAFRVADKDGNKGESMTDFDPSAERMIMVLPMQGG